MFLTLSERSQKLLAFWQTFFGRVLKTAFIVSIGSFRENFFEKKVAYFLTFSHTVQTLYGFQSNIFQQGCRKKLSKFFFISGHWQKKFAFLTKTNAVGLSKLFSTCSQEQFERNIFFKKSLEFFLFLRTWAKNFGFLSNSFRLDCQKCILRTQTNNSRKNIF